MRTIITKITAGLITLAAAASIITAAGCAGTSGEAANSSANQTLVITPTQKASENTQSPPTETAVSAPTDISPRPTGMPNLNSNAMGDPGQMPGLDSQISEAAVKLGIDEQTLKDAFNQAQNELRESMPTPAEMTGTPEIPDMTETPPDGNGGIMPGRGGLSDELFNKVARILGLDEQTVKEAFSATMPVSPATLEQ
jgi:hypothetical protein